MAEARTSLPVVRRFAETSRRDRWWVQPLLVFLVLSAFIVYATWAAFQGEHYYLEKDGRHYLSPFYSPELVRRLAARLVRAKPAWWPAWLPFSPALLILWAPGGLPLHLLLLPRRLLQGVLGRPARLRRRRAAQELLGRAHLAAGPAERPPLLPVPGRAVHRSCWPGTPSRRSGSRTRTAFRFGVGVGSLVLTRQRLSCWAATRSAAIRCGTWSAGGIDQLSKAPDAPRAYECVSCLNRRHMVWAWCSLFWVAFSDLYVRLCSMGLDDLRIATSERIVPLAEHHEPDGLPDPRARRPGHRRRRRRACGPPSRPPPRGVSVGLVCKSLLGKAHTVMAEGGIAAALANVDDRDNWKVHFADTMRGGQYVNNWRMAQLHAQEAPDRVRELEAWGAVFDRTPDGRILQRNFGGHRYPRLAHVGDRTGLEMIRTCRITASTRASRSTWNAPSSGCSRTATASPGRLAYYRERGRFVVFRAKAVVLATGGIGKAYKITSNSWEYTGDGHTLAYDAGAELQDMEFVQFHPDRDDLAAQRAGASW